MQMKSRECYVIAGRAMCRHRIMLSPDNSTMSLRHRPCHVTRLVTVDWR